MTDEQLGRLWAKKHGKRPYETESGYFGWQSQKWTSSPAHSLPAFIHSMATGHFSESDAYAELGRAIRQVLVFADEVRAMGVTS